MKSRKTAKQPDDGRNWTRWMGLGAQFAVAIGLSLWAGIWLDKRLGNRRPLLVWILPLLLIAVMLFQLVRQTAKRNDGNKDHGQ